MYKHIFDKVLNSSLKIYVSHNSFLLIQINLFIKFFSLEFPTIHLNNTFEKIYSFSKSFFEFIQNLHTFTRIAHLRYLLFTFLCSKKKEEKLKSRLRIVQLNLIKGYK